MSTSATNNNKRTFPTSTALDNEDKHQITEKRNKIKEEEFPSLNLETKTRLNELIIEKLDFIPLHFVDDIINSINNLLYQALDSFKIFLKTRLSGELQINQGMHEIETLLESSIDKNFDLFELYCLNNVFNFNLEEVYDNKFYQYLDEDPHTAEQIDNIERELEGVAKELSIEKAKSLELDKALNNKLKIYNPRLKTYEELKRLTQLLKQYQIVHLKDHFNLIKENIEKILNNNDNVNKELEELKGVDIDKLITEKECYFEDRILTRLKFLPRASHMPRTSQEILDVSQINNRLINGGNGGPGKSGDNESPKCVNDNADKAHDSNDNHNREDVTEIEEPNPTEEDNIEVDLKNIEIVDWSSLNNL